MRRIQARSRSQAEGGRERGGTKADNLYQKKEEEEEWSVGGGGEILGAI
jgi:hypothetical protein